MVQKKPPVGLGGFGCFYSLLLFTLQLSCCFFAQTKLSVPNNEDRNKDEANKEKGNIQVHFVLNTSL